MTSVASLFEANAERGPSFDVIRLFAAVAVLVSHCAIISNQYLIPDFSHGEISLGVLAVAVFFVLSGFVVTASFRRDPRPLQFLRKRALRIYPALILVVALSALVLGPLLTNLPLGSYFSDPRTALYLTNGLLTLNYVDLPGVFASHPVTWINGSLWTLRYEILCYATLALFGATLLKRPALVVAIALLGGVLSEAITLYVALRSSGNGAVVHEVWQASMTVAYFFGGSALLLFGDKVPVKPTYIIGASVLLVFSLVAYGFNVVFPFAGAYLIVVLGNTRALEFASIRRGAFAGDFSYGFYITAFPVQQLLRAALGPSADFWTLLALSLPLVLVIAMISWNFVEKPFLRLKYDARGLMPRAA